MSQIFILIVKEWCIQDGNISFAQNLMHPRIHNICLSEFWYIQVEKICLFELVDIQIIEKISKKLKSKHKWNLSSYYEFHYSLNPEDEQGAAEGGPEASIKSLDLVLRGQDLAHMGQILVQNGPKGQNPIGLPRMANKTTFPLSLQPWV